MRSTLDDIARHAGVSKATVDRVLNERTGVRAQTREAVLEVAVRLGYIHDANLPVAPDTKVTRLDFILPEGSNIFMKILQKELQEQSAVRADIEAHFHLVDGFDPETLAEKLRGLKSETEGIGLVTIDHPAIREAIRDLARSGVKVVTLVSDVRHVPRVGYIGIDNRSAGRLTGFLLQRFLGPGRHKVALFAGSIAYCCHEDREMGFRQILNEQPGRVDIVGFSEIHDDNERSYSAAMEHLERQPDLSALYCIGAGKRGIAQALEETGRGSDVLFFGHDLTAHTKDLLLNGVMDTIIDQNPYMEARDALEQLSRAVRGRSWNARSIHSQIICKENIPEEIEMTGKEPRLATD